MNREWLVTLLGDLANESLLEESQLFCKVLQGNKGLDPVLIAMLHRLAAESVALVGPGSPMPGEFSSRAPRVVSPEGNAGGPHPFLMTSFNLGNGPDFVGPWSEAPSDLPSSRAMSSTSTLEKIQRLRAASVFASTPVNVLAALADGVEEVRLAPNEQLFAKGDLSTSMYVIVDGLVRVHIGDQTVVELTDGEIVGELAALDPEPRSASVSAIDPTTLYRIEQKALQSLMADHPETVQGIIRELSHRLRQTNEPYGFSS